MNVFCLGLSHRTAPVELRERLALSPAARDAALARLGQERKAGAVPGELVLLSTCNRLELYIADSAAQPAALVDWVEQIGDLSAEEFAPHGYTLAGAAAAAHLCRVAAGLDSVVLGEPQILGQVAEAHEAARAHGACGPALSALFRAALRAGKRARAETAIGRNSMGAGAAAVRLAESVLGPLSAARALVVGAGEMAELAVKALRLRGAQEIVVANRTLDRAQRLAARWGAAAVPFAQLGDALARADVAICATGAPQAVVTRDLAESALRRRPERALVFVDIAVPRDVDPAVAELTGARCYVIDDLNLDANGAAAERALEVPKVEAIAAEETEAFLAWQRARAVVPVIAGLRERAHAIRRGEVEKALRRMPDLTPRERRRIEAMSEALVNKLLHEPTLRLKVEAQNGRARLVEEVVRTLFRLDEADGRG